MNQEIERKFKLNVQQFDSFIDKHTRHISGTYDIDQYYLVNKDKQTVTVSEYGWKVCVNNQEILIPLLDGEFDKIKELNLQEKENLIGLPETSCRFRFKVNIGKGDEKTIFTFKIGPDTNLLEFEYELGSDKKNDVSLVCNEIHSKIIKRRLVYSVGFLEYELDVFCDLDLIVLEVEFKTQEDADRFVPNFMYELEGTGDTNFSNLTLSLIVEAESKNKDRAR